MRKLLGACSLAALRACDPARPDAKPEVQPEVQLDAQLEDYVDAMGSQLHARRHAPRAQAAGNSYGESVLELALGLVYELRARPADWQAFCTAVAGESDRLADALLRKKVNDMYAQLRDKVDADNYQAACGRPCSPNRMYAYRMLDTAYGELARLFGNWTQHLAQVGAILGRPLAPGSNAAPIEVRQLRTIGDCRPEWLMRWSETLERFTGSAGPLHTRSKRFASLKTSPDKIGAMLREIGEYEALSANRDLDFARDLDDASVWMEDYWRILQESEDAATPGPDQILEARQDALDQDPVADDEGAPEPGPAPSANPHDEAIAASVSLPPGYLQMAAEAEAGGGWITRALLMEALPVRLAVYARLLGPADDSYPDAWRDPASGELPTMQQLASLARISLPTLRKRRDAAIARIEQEASARAMTRRRDDE